MSNLTNRLKFLIEAAIGAPEEANELIDAVENAGISSVNGLEGDINLVAGTNISITPSGNNLTIAVSGGSGANDTLSNLDSPTAVNQDLIFNKSSPIIQSKDTTSTTASESISLKSGTPSGNAASGDINIGSANTLGGFHKPSGTININTGNNAGGDSGSMFWTVGTSGGSGVPGEMKWEIGPNSINASGSNGMRWIINPSSAGANPGGFIFNAPAPTGGGVQGDFAIVANNLDLSGTTKAINFTTIYDSAGTPLLSINVATRQLVDTANYPVVDWSQNQLNSSTGGTASLSWYYRRLFDSSGTHISIDWEARTLSDINGDTAASWDVSGLSTKGLSITSGANKKMGTVDLAGGTATVMNSSITANSLIYITSQVDGGVPGFLRVNNKVVSTSFDIISSNIADTSTVAWFIVEQS